MKKAIVLAVFLMSAFTIFARMSYQDSSRLAIPAAEELLQEIIEVTGLQGNITIKAANVLNIEAVVSHHKQYIYYNPGYVSWLNALTKDKWAVLALLAHEVGHHLNGHTIRKTGSRPELELEADEFAGFVLYKLGATLEQAQQVMNYIAKPVASKTHPARLSRLMAIKAGWDKASNTAATAIAVK
jgi:hypothetical protein